MLHCADLVPSLLLTCLPIPRCVPASGSLSLLHLSFSASLLSLCTLRPCRCFPSMLSSWAHNLSPSYGSFFGLTRPSPSLIFSSRMARDHSRHCLRQQVRQPRCPSCGKRFTNILRHLNHRDSKCADWFNAANPHHNHQLPSSHHEHPLDSPRHHEYPLDSPDHYEHPINSPDHYEHPINSPTDPSPSEDAPGAPQSPPSPHHVRFPHTARTYGRAKTFMDKFRDDQYSELRTSNIYYLFSGKAEWGLALFLLSSGLSMRKINEFLQLQMVSYCSYTIRKAH